MSKIMNNAWLIVRKVIEEAKGRYDLDVFGRVEAGVWEVDVVKVVFVDVRSLIRFSQVITPEFLATTYDAELFAETGLYPLLRPFAEMRDKKRRVLEACGYTEAQLRYIFGSRHPTLVFNDRGNGGAVAISLDGDVTMYNFVRRKDGLYYLAAVDGEEVARERDRN